MKIISLFSGAGGLDLGLIQAGNKVIWANDIDKDAVATYRENIGNHIICDDIRNIDVSTLPDADVVVGGFPCQGFSQANRLRTVGLIPDDSRGMIRLTDFGRRVADHDISQTEFSAITIQTFKLPNSHIQSAAECLNWESHSLIIYPLRIILSVILELKKRGQGYLTTAELTKIMIPLSGCHAQIEDYVNFILWYRAGEVALTNWPNCCEGANDFRIAREYLLFLENYGYLEKTDGAARNAEQYHINTLIESEISEILATPVTDASLQTILDQIRTSEVASEVERKRVQNYRISRPNQARFRHAVLAACQRCIITNVTMPEVLEAAHIKPFKYNAYQPRKTSDCF